MTPNQITSLLVEKDAQIKAEEKKIASWIPAEASWRSQSTVVCDQVLQRNRDACVADKAYKRARADEYQSNIDAARARIDKLRKEIDQLLESQAANDQVEINLSQAGTSYDATIVEAEAKAESTRKISDAEAKAISTNSMFIVGGVVVLLILGGILLYRRLSQ